MQLAYGLYQEVKSLLSDTTKRRGKARREFAEQKREAVKKYLATVYYSFMQQENTDDDTGDKILEQAAVVADKAADDLVKEFPQAATVITQGTIRASEYIEETWRAAVEAYKEEKGK